MSLTTGQLQSQLDAITKARNSGVLMVRHGDTHTTFRTLAEMNQVIATLTRQIAAASGKKRSKVNYIEQRTRGYGHDC
jgi:hypothetical protein